MRLLGITVGMVAAVTFVSGVAQAQDIEVVYSQTSPTPNVASAPHSSIPAALGFWEDAGLEVQNNSVNGSTLAVQLTNAGTSHFTMASVEPLMVAQEKGGDVIAIYNHTREPIYTVAVPADSDITALEQLKGKRIGVLSLSSGAVPFAKAMLAGAGLDPESDVEYLPIGLGAQAVQAIQTGQVDALALWDWAYAQLENAGIEIRHFTSPETDTLLGLMLVGNGEFVREHPDVAVKLAQGIAKASLFTVTNPEAAVRIHWEHYPESKPTGIPEEQALKEAVHLLESRLPKYAIEGREVEKFGGFTEAEWNDTREFLYANGVIMEKLDIDEYYTTDLVDQINDFDAASIIEQAKAYK
jgi:NitT/TauT family transport system substrate-binding protein